MKQLFYLDYSQLAQNSDSVPYQVGFDTDLKIRASLTTLNRRVFYRYEMAKEEF